jgi:hypothetical protein
MIAGWLFSQSLCIDGCGRDWLPLGMMVKKPILAKQTSAASRAIEDLIHVVWGERWCFDAVSRLIAGLGR